MVLLKQSFILGNGDSRDLDHLSKLRTAPIPDSTKLFPHYSLVYITRNHVHHSHHVKLYR